MNATTMPPWLALALADRAIKEIPGPASNPVILQMARDIKAPKWFDNDDHPWCAVYANHKLWQAQLKLSGTGFDLLRAASFKPYGVGLEEPALGCLLVFSRPEGFHVGFYLGENTTKYRVWGGNQSNQVGAAWIAKARCVALRWPKAVALPSGGPIHLNGDGQASRNEG